MGRYAFHMFTVVLSVLTALAFPMGWSRPHPFDDTQGLLAAASILWLPWAATKLWRSAMRPAGRASAPSLLAPDADFADTVANWHPVEHVPTQRAAGG
ncbi:hypothetical protein [Methylibium rhizosphaerae]|uniref:hypothetical protein n=1 Tax=Methylibium rhizosphaerae TaxID=2570323 RepID=UPI0011260CC8|nr:hypothetical protein [Methylibium rhizosphaerae]